MNQELIDMAKAAGVIEKETPFGSAYFADAEDLEAFAALVEAKARETEREACAKVCEDMERSGHWITKTEAAYAIRARGEKKL